MRHALVVAAALSTCILVEPVRAECITTTASSLMMRSEVLFHGTVTEVVRTAGISSYRATFQVDRVWKGGVSERIDVFVDERDAEASPGFRVGRAYMVSAKRLTDTSQRLVVGVTDATTVAYGPVQCGPEEWQAAAIARDLGPGQAPK